MNTTREHCGWPQGCRYTATDGDRCPTHAWLEDALWLLDQGEHPLHVARRVGKSMAALEGGMRRIGSRHAVACMNLLKTGAAA